MEPREPVRAESRTCAICDQAIDGHIYYYGVTTPRIAASLTSNRRCWQELTNGTIRVDLCPWCASEVNQTVALFSVPARSRLHRRSARLRNAS